jgi:hypothetical protein
MLMMPLIEERSLGDLATHHYNEREGIIYQEFPQKFRGQTSLIVVGNT